MNLQTASSPPALLPPTPPTNRIRKHILPLDEREEHKCPHHHFERKCRIQECSAPQACWIWRNHLFLSPPPPALFFPLFSRLQMDPSPSLFFFFLVVVLPPLPTRSRQWDDTLRPAAGINMQGGQKLDLHKPFADIIKKRQLRQQAAASGSRAII